MSIYRSAAGRVPPSSLTTWMTLVGRHVRTSLAPAPVRASTRRAVAGARCVVVAGRHDAFLPPRPLTRAFAKTLPGVPVRLVVDAGHLLPHERPDVIVEIVREHIAASGRRRDDP